MLRGTVSNVSIPPRLILIVSTELEAPLSQLPLHTGLSPTAHTDFVVNWERFNDNYTT